MDGTKSGAEAGITAPSKDKKAEEQTPAPIAHDSILDMFSEDE